MCVPGLAAYLRAADAGASDVGPAAVVLIPAGPVEEDRPDLVTAALVTAQVTAPATAGVTAPGTTATEGRA